MQKHTKAALQFEQGVLSLYAMYEKADPERVTVLEIYASKETYQLHIETPHFPESKSSTTHMVKSPELTDVEPHRIFIKAKFIGGIKTKHVK